MNNYQKRKKIEDGQIRDNMTEDELPTYIEEERIKHEKGVKVFSRSKKFRDNYERTFGHE